MSSRVVRPSAASPGYAPVVSTAYPTPEVPRSRLATRRAVAPVELVVPNYPYGWVEPPVWVDGARYDAEILDAQIVRNPTQVVHPLVTLTEDYSLTTGTSGVWSYIPVLDFPVLANETWYLIFALLSESENDGYYFGAQVPPGSEVGAQLSYRRNSDGASIQDVWNRYTGDPDATWSNWADQVYNEGGTGATTFYPVEAVVTTATSGSVQPVVASLVSSNAVKVHAGSTILGVRLYP